MNCTLDERTGGNAGRTMRSASIEAGLRGVVDLTGQPVVVADQFGTDLLLFARRHHERRPRRRPLPQNGDRQISVVHAGAGRTAALTGNDVAPRTAGGGAGPRHRRHDPLCLPDRGGWMTFDAIQ